MIDFETISINDLTDNLGDYLLEATAESAASWLEQLFLFETAQRFGKALEPRRAAEQAKLDSANEARESLRAAMAAETPPKDYRSRLGMLTHKLEHSTSVLAEIDAIIRQLSQIEPPPPLAALERWNEAGYKPVETAPPIFRPGPKKMAQMVERFLRGRVQFEQKEFVS